MGEKSDFNYFKMAQSKSLAQKHSLRRSIFLSFLALMLVPVLLIGGVVVYASITGSQQIVESKLLALSALKEAAINRWLDSVVGRLTESSSLDIAARTLYEFKRRPAFEEHLISSFRHDIMAIRGNSNDFETVFLMDLKGKVKASTMQEQVGLLYDRQEFFQRGLKDTYIQPLFYDNGEQSAVLYISTPVTYANGELMGVLAAKVNLQTLADILSETTGQGQESDSASESYLLIQNGIVLHSDLQARPEAQFSKGAARGSEGQKGVALYDNYAGISVFGSYRPLDQLGVALLVEQHLAETFRTIIRAALSILLISIVIAALTMYVAYKLTNRIVLPIQTLTQAATDIAAGDLDKAISPERDDEIGILAQAFAQMTSQLRNLINTLESRVQGRTQSLQTSVEVSHNITGILELGPLLVQVSDLLQKSYGFYCVRVLLKDERNYLETRAGSGDIGKKMAVQSQKVKLGSESLIGQAGLGRHQVINNTAQDPRWPPDPRFPEAASELALPIRYGDAVLGVLDLHCYKENAFSDENIPILQSIADQVAIAVRNARLFQESEAARRELEEISRSLTHRSAQLQTAIEVSKAAGAIRDPNKLIGQAVDLIKDHFNFYYVGLFLLDEGGEWAALQAGTGPVGQKQLAAKHRLKIDDASMIGWSIVHKKARIASDVRQDTVHYVNPFLPETQSEMALPLVRRDEVLGAISIQSTRHNAYTEDDINVLQSVADQIAIALQNSRLLTRVQSIQARFEDLYHRAPAGYHTMSTDGLILEINDTELAMLGYQGRRAEIINRSNISAFIAEESEIQCQVAMEMLLSGNKVENLELFFRRRDGSRLPVLVTAAPEQSRKGEIREIYASVQDISRQREAETARASLLEETETLYKLSQKLLTADSLTEIYQVGIDAIKTTNPSQGIAVFRCDPSPQRMQMELVALWQNPEREWPSPPLGSTFSAEKLGLRDGIVLSGQTAFSIDAPNDERYNESLRQLLRDMGIKSLVSAPLWSRGLVIGFILVAHYTARPFSEADIRLIEGVARQISLSVDNLTLLQEAFQRAAQLEAAAEVAKNTTSEVDLGALLSKVVDLLEDSFDYYHTAIFLVDDYQQYAVVEAAAGAADKELFIQKYKLPLDMLTQVGSVVKTGKARITPDVAMEADFLPHPLLPDTRSELTLPLIVHGKIIGALDVQSDKVNDFELGEDVVLQTIADQLANAIYVARLFASERAAAQDIQRLHKYYLQEEWAAFLDSKESGQETSFALLPDPLLTARSAELRDWFSLTAPDDTITPLSLPLPSGDEDSPLWSTLISPLALRDTSIGALGLIDRDERAWSEDDLAIIEAVSAQAALAIENARLIEKNRRWALEQQETVEKLREVDKLKTQFLANMSHELRTPLNSIIGFSRVILKGIDGPLTELQKTDLSSIYQSGKHLLDLINNILDLAKIEAGKIDLNFELVDLYVLLSGIVPTLIGLVKDKKIKIVEDIPDDIPFIQGDETRVRQIFLNLVSNSAKFTQEGSITISASYNREEVSVSVSDTGIGIAAKDMEAIFDEFSQVDASTTRRVGGTGLGLPITRKFVELHHGQISIESKLNVGSTFTVALPIKQPKPDGAGDEVTLQSDQIEEVQPPTLLVIDRDYRVIDYYRQYLHAKDVEVVSLNGGAEALEKAKELQPYAILLDVVLPDVDGWGVLGELKENPNTAHIPVIICSLVDDKFRANQLGAADYLVKPIIKNDLLHAIERLEAHKKNLKQVLVIDDHAEDILLIKRILRSHECQIIEALNGLDGLDIIYRNRPNLVVLDLTMPGLDGFGVLGSLRDNPKTRKIPVIVITARDLSREERKTIKQQANALLLKGKYTDSELLQYVDQFLQAV